MKFLCLASINILPDVKNQEISATDETKLLQVKKMLSEGKVKQAWEVILG